MARQVRLSASRARQKAAKLLSRKDLPAAREAYLKACELAPDDANAWLELGEVNGMMRDLQGAEMAYQRALTFNRDLPQAHLKLGRLAARRNQWPVAERHQRALLDLQPNNLRTYLELGVSLEGQGRQQEAEQIYRQALAMNDSRAELHVALCRVLRVQGQFHEARSSIERALQMTSDMALAHLENGHLLREDKQYEAAFDAYKRFGRLAPQERLTFLSNCGGVLVEMELAEEALRCYTQLAKEFPQSADVRLARAMQLLTLGEFEEGWREYEWRRASLEWRSSGDNGYSALRPPWQGESLQGKRVLVYVEQGFGDAIQFCRFLPRLTEMGATVHFHCQSVLTGLLSTMAGVDKVESLDLDQVDRKEFDYFISLMSLPYLLDTNAGTIPAEIPYLQVDNKQQAFWQQRLAQDSFKVGLVWAGSGGHLKDKRRSLSLDDLGELADVKNVSWYSLQKGPAEQELATTDTPLEIIDLAPEINDFSDTAAIIANLDLVICVDTSVAHLAGALGCPTWVMLYNGPDWRWQLEREDSPWYPSLRLFRQVPGEKWPAVVERVARALEKTLSGV